MNWIMSVINYFQTNWSDFIQIYLQIIGLASIIVKLTPTLKDDDALKWLVKFVGKYLALNRGSGTPKV